MNDLTTTKPLTYGAASKIATPVNTDELRDLIAQDDNPDIFSGKGKVRRVGWNLRIRTAGTAVWICWDCDYGDGDGEARWIANWAAHYSTCNKEAK